MNASKKSLDDTEGDKSPYVDAEIEDGILFGPFQDSLSAEEA